MWTSVFDWSVIGIVVPLLIGVGLGVMSMSPPEFLIAKWCFGVSALILFWKTTIWLVGISSSASERVVFTFAAFSFIGVGLVESLRWIESRQAKLVAIDAANQQEVPLAKPPLDSGTLQPSVGGIDWNLSGFLGGGVYGEHGVRIGGFQASAVNHTGATLRDVHGYIESLITGKRFELFLNINGFPVKPEDTNGIPNGASFLVYAPFKPGEKHGISWEQLTLNEFLSELGEFEFVFVYDGKQFARKFTKNEVDAATQHWKEIVSGPTVPRVTKKGKSPE